MVKNLLETFLKPNLSIFNRKWPLSPLKWIQIYRFWRKMTDFDENWRREGHEKRLLDYFYDMNLVRNVQKCSKMRSLKLKRKRGDWKSLKKVRKKSFVWRGIFFDLLDSVFWLLIGWKFFSSSRDLRHLRHRRQSPPSGNTNRVANRL